MFKLFGRGTGHTATAAGKPARKKLKHLRSLLAANLLSTSAANRVNALDDLFATVQACEARLFSTLAYQNTQWEKKVHEFQKQRAEIISKRDEQLAAKTAAEKLDVKAHTDKTHDARVRTDADTAALIARLDHESYVLATVIYQTHRSETFNFWAILMNFYCELASCYLRIASAARDLEGPVREDGELCFARLSEDAAQGQDTEGWRWASGSEYSQRVADCVNEINSFLVSMESSAQPPAAPVLPSTAALESAEAEGSRLATLCNTLKTDTAKLQAELQAEQAAVAALRDKIDAKLKDL